jgi:hypothetical protein
VAVLATTLVSGLSSPEVQILSSIGYSADLIDPSTWDSMTTKAFHSYSAIVLADPDCGDDSAISAAEANTYHSVFKGVPSCPYLDTEALPDGKAVVLTTAWSTTGFPPL